jgi:hypothetical protein
MTKDKVVGKVIEIPNDKTLIISKEEKNSLSIGDNLQICEESNDIKNFDNEIIGKFYFIKDTVEVTEVYDKYVICKKLTRRNTSPITNMNNLFKDSIEIVEDKLNVNDKDNKKLTIKNKEISIGDVVKKIL